MTTQLYDLSENDAGVRRLLMRAPVSIIAMFACLHSAAVKRIIYEAKDGNECTIHKDTGQIFFVTKAIKPLGPIC